MCFTGGRGGRDVLHHEEVDPAERALHQVPIGERAQRIHADEVERTEASLGGGCDELAAGDAVLARYEPRP